jgi:mannose-6-phosphate isomerase-like protein (cupin superfamily)
MRRNWCRQAFIFPGTDDPNVASFDVVLGKGGSGGGNALVHLHPLAEERFLITSGRIKVVFDGRPQLASAHSRLWHH